MAPTRIGQDQIQNLETDLSTFESVDDSIEDRISLEESIDDSIEDSLEAKISQEESESDAADDSLEILIDSIEVSIGATGPGISKKTFGITIDGAGQNITTGVKSDIVIPYNMTITGWTIVSQQTGDIVIDVWKSNYSNYPPTSLNSIAGLQKPTLTDSSKNQNLSLTSWTTSVSAGDIVRFNVDSCDSIMNVTLVIEGNLTL